MSQTKPNLKVRALWKGVEFNSLSNACKFNIPTQFIVPVVTLNRFENVFQKI